MMLQRRWQGCVFLMLSFLLCTGPGMTTSSEETSSRPSEFATVTVPNKHLEHIASFREEADLWVLAHVARILPTTRVTHVLAGDDVLTSSPGDAYLLVPAMLNLRSALAAAGLDGRVRVTTTAASAPARSDDVVAHVLRFLRATGAPLFLKSSRPSSDAAFAAVRALGVPVVAGELGARRGGEVATFYGYSCHPRGGDGGGGGGKRRSLATGTFCVALQNANPAALQAGLDWACGPGHADCSEIQPDGPCYQENNLPALASYAYNDYYQRQSSTGATCSFNGTATTTTNDPSSGSCVFTGSSAAGGSNSSTPVGATPPPSVAPPAGGFTPPAGSSPPAISTTPPTGFTPPVGATPPTSFAPPAGGFTPPAGSSPEFSPPAVGTTPPTSFTPPAGGGFGSPPSDFGPPGAFNGSGSFGPTGTLSPYGAACRGAVSSAGLAALSAVAVAVLLVSMDVM